MILSWERDITLAETTCHLNIKISGRQSAYLYILAQLLNTTTLNIQQPVYFISRTN